MPNIDYESGKAQPTLTQLMDEFAARKLAEMQHELDVSCEALKVALREKAEQAAEIERLKEELRRRKD